jgi:hypothetical protein
MMDDNEPDSYRRHVLHATAPALVVGRPWVIMFHMDSGRFVPAQSYVSTHGRSEVPNFRALYFCMSSVPKARLDVELRISSERFPLGMCDTWMRRSTLPTAYVKSIHLPTLGPANDIEVRVFNRYQRLSTPVAFCIEGVFA